MTKAKKKPCSYCGGRKMIFTIIDCPVCKGTKKKHGYSCGACSATGWKISGRETCPRCKGTGDEPD